MARSLNKKLEELDGDVEHDIVREVLEALYGNDDGTWDPDRELDAETAEKVAQVYGSRGLLPTKEDREKDESDD